MTHSSRSTISTCLVSKHRFFVWTPDVVIPENVVVNIARNDDEIFGVVQSRFHQLWALGLCTWLGKGNDPRYTPSTTFETFPFPDGLTPELPAANFSNPAGSLIAAAAMKLNILRESWLNPPEWVDRVPEVVQGYPERLIPKEQYEADMKKRTMTNLYNEYPAWLDNVHRELDLAVAAAYGWSADLKDDDVLANLLELNLSRAAEGE